MRNVNQFLDEVEKEGCSKWNFIQAWNRKDKKKMDEINDKYREIKKRYEN